jgi:hypothetical protein
LYLRLLVPWPSERTDLLRLYARPRQSRTRDFPQDTRRDCAACGPFGKNYAPGISVLSEGQGTKSRRYKSTDFFQGFFHNTANVAVHFFFFSQETDILNDMCCIMHFCLIWITKLIKVGRIDRCTIHCTADCKAECIVMSISREHTSRELTRGLWCFLLVIITVRLQLQINGVGWVPVSGCSAD